MERFNAQLSFPDWLRHDSLPIETIDVNPVEPIFATGGWDKKVHVWTVASVIEAKSRRQTRLLATISKHDDYVNCVRWSPDGKLLASCSDDGSVYISKKSNKPPLGAEIDDDNFLSKKCQDAMRPKERWVSSLLQGHSSDVKAVAWTPDGATLISGSIDGVIIFWNVRTLRPGLEIKLDTGVRALSVDPAGCLLATQELCGAVSVFDMKGRLVARLEECLTKDVQRSSNAKINWSPDGAFICGSNGFSNKFIVPFFCRNSYNIGFTLEGHVGPVPVIAFAPKAVHFEGKIQYLLATGDMTGLVAVWALGGESPKPLCILNNLSQGPINDISWLPDASGFIAAVAEDRIRRNGGIVVFKIKDGMSFELLTDDEMVGLRTKVSCERLPTTHAHFSDDDEPDEPSVKRLSTEMIMKLQVETRSKDGIVTIKPVLLSQVMKPIPAFATTIAEQPVRDGPFLFSDTRLPWAKPAALSDKPSHVIVCGNYVWLAVNNMLVVLSAATGRRVALPSVIGKCTTLIGNDSVVLAVGSQCFIFDVSTAKLLQTMPVHSDFQEYDITKWPMVIARSGTCEWCWGINEGAWIGGIDRLEYGDLSIDEITAIAEQTPEMHAAWALQRSDLMELWTSQFG